MDTLTVSMVGACHSNASVAYTPTSPFHATARYLEKRRHRGQTTILTDIHQSLLSRHRSIVSVVRLYRVMSGTASPGTTGQHPGHPTMATGQAGWQKFQQSKTAAEETKHEDDDEAIQMVAAYFRDMRAPDPLPFGCTLPLERAVDLAASIPRCLLQPPQHTDTNEPRASQTPVTSETTVVGEFVVVVSGMPEQDPRGHRLLAAKSLAEGTLIWSEPVPAVRATLVMGGEPGGAAAALTRYPRYIAAVTQETGGAPPTAHRSMHSPLSFAAVLAMELLSNGLSYTCLAEMGYPGQVAMDSQQAMDETAFVPAVAAMIERWNEDPKATPWYHDRDPPQAPFQEGAHGIAPQGSPAKAQPDPMLQRDGGSVSAAWDLLRWVLAHSTRAEVPLLPQVCVGMVISRLLLFANSSCDPNVQPIVANDGSVRVYTTTTIEAGTELCVPHSSTVCTSLPWTSRSPLVVAEQGFRCLCLPCRQEASDVVGFVARWDTSPRPATASHKKKRPATVLRGSDPPATALPLNGSTAVRMTAVLTSWINHMKVQLATTDPPGGSAPVDLLRLGRTEKARASAGRATSLARDQKGLPCPSMSMRALAFLPSSLEWACTGLRLDTTLFIRTHVQELLQELACARTGASLAAVLRRSVEQCMWLVSDAAVPPQTFWTLVDLWCRYLVLADANHLQRWWIQPLTGCRGPEADLTACRGTGTHVRLPARVPFQRSMAQLTEVSGRTYQHVVMAALGRRMLLVDAIQASGVGVRIATGVHVLHQVAQLVCMSLGLMARVRQAVPPRQVGDPRPASDGTSSGAGGGVSSPIVLTDSGILQQNDAYKVLLVQFGEGVCDGLSGVEHLLRAAPYTATIHLMYATLAAICSGYKPSC